MKLRVGDTAPDFTLPAVQGSHRITLALSDFRGKQNVVLAFYPLNWTPVCTNQMSSYNDSIGRLAVLDAQLIGINVDSPYSHMAWQEHSTGPLDFPLASDFYPHGMVAQAYGVLRTEEVPLAGINQRALFIVDKQGKIAMARIYELGEVPPIEDALQVLDQLQEKDAHAIVEAGRR